MTPALARQNNGNWHTARRWQEFLAPVARVAVALEWQGERADALIALHARRSAESIERFHAAHPQRPLALVLTGTDLYRDIETDARAARMLDVASHLVVLNEDGPSRLNPEQRTRTRVIVQSAPRLVRTGKSTATTDFVAVGHLRDEKDPLTMIRATLRLPRTAKARFFHIGDALDAEIAAAGREASERDPRYTWLGGLPHGEARRRIAISDALVHASRMEGGANVIIEAVRSAVPVLASRISGNIGLLGADYAGYFAVSDDAALAELMLRFIADKRFRARLGAQCAARVERFAPAAERGAVRRLVGDMLNSDG